MSVAVCSPVVRLVNGDPLTGHENETVLVMDHLDLPCGTVFKVANLVVVGAITSAGRAEIQVAGTLYNLGQVGGAQMMLRAPRMLNPSSPGWLEELRKNLCVPVSLSEKGVIVIPAEFVKAHS